MNIKDIFASKLFQKVFRYIFSVAIGLAIFLPIYLLSDKSLIKACDATFIPGCVLLALSIFSILNYHGFFDFAGYGFVSILQSLRKGSIREYDDLIDYKNKKMVTRKENKLAFLVYLVFALIWLIAALAIRLCIKY